jgi:uncharacterized pyridoxal phosphate-containing UPF0001 family protein
VVLLAGLCVTDIGENRAQEASAKVAEVMAAGVKVRWHSSSANCRETRQNPSYGTPTWSSRSTRYASPAHWTTRPGGTGPRRLDVLVQGSIDGDPARGGAAADAPVPDRDLWRIADGVAASEGLRLRGVMAVAPLDWDPDARSRRSPRSPPRLAADHPGATAVSLAERRPGTGVRHGATHVRIGTSLLGMRNPLR